MVTKLDAVIMHAVAEKMIQTGYYKTFTKHISDFLELEAAVDLLSAQIYPNTKEITEATGAFRAAWKYLKRDFRPDDPDVTVVCVGDGRTPRVGALCAFLTRWNCISIDPIMKKTTWTVPTGGTTIKRLICIPDVVENVTIDVEKLLIMAIHSHAPLDKVLTNLTGETRAMVAIPSCIPIPPEIPNPDIEYIDTGIWSPKNTVKIWRHI